MTSSPLSIGLLIVAVTVFIVWRQLRATPLRTTPLKLPAVLGVIGAIRAGDYLSAHPDVPLGEMLGVAAGLVCAAVIAYPRAHSMAVYRAGEVWMRRGNLRTLGWWVVSLAAHLACAAAVPALFGVHGFGMSDFDTSTLMLYLAVTLGVQLWILHHRAQSAGLVKLDTSAVGDDHEPTRVRP